MRTICGAILAAAVRRRRSRPRGRAVDRAAVGQRDLIWQLTAAGHVARYVLVKGGKLLQFITSPVVGVVNSDWFLQPVANRRDWTGEIGISAYQGKSIDAIDKHGIEKHFCSDVHVRSLLFKFDDRGHAICFVAGNAWLLEERLKMLRPGCPGLAPPRQCLGGWMLVLYQNHCPCARGRISANFACRGFQFVQTVSQMK